MKILAIGNSFSDDTLWRVWDVANSLGTRLKLGNLYIGGCPIDSHVNNAKNDLPAYEFRTNTDGNWVTRYETTLKYALESDDWDIIMMHQASPDSGQPESYANVAWLADYVKANTKPDIKLVWNMTWAYQSDSTHSQFYRYDHSQAIMYGAIIGAIHKAIVPLGIFDKIIPTGHAIQLARASKLGDTLTRDGFHLSFDMGRYVAALTFVACVLEADVSHIKYAPESLTKEERQIAIDCAVRAQSLFQK